MGEKRKRKCEDLLPDRVRLIEARYARRFRLLVHIALYVVVAILLFARNSTYNQDLFHSDVTGLLMWAVILLLHIVEVLTEEARDRTVERLLVYGLSSGPARGIYSRLVDSDEPVDYEFIGGEDEIEAGYS